MATLRPQSRVLNAVEEIPYELCASMCRFSQEVRLPITFDLHILKHYRPIHVIFNDSMVFQKKTSRLELICFLTCLR